MKTLIAAFILVSSFTYGQNIRNKVKGFENDTVVEYDDNINVERYVYRNEVVVIGTYVKDITMEVVERYVEEFNAFLYLNYVTVDEYDGGDNVPEKIYFFTPELVLNTFNKFKHSSTPKIQFTFWRNNTLYDFTIMENLFNTDSNKAYLICFTAS